MPNSNDSTQNGNSDEIDIVDLIGALWDGKWIIIGVTALITILGTIYVYTTPVSTTANLPIALTQEANQTLDNLNWGLDQQKIARVEKTTLFAHAKSRLAAYDWPVGLSGSTIATDDNTESLQLSFNVADSFEGDTAWIEAMLIDLNEGVSKVIQAQQNIVVNDRISLLEDQLEIAKAIGQTKSIFQASEGQIPSSTSFDKLPYYHFGSIAIETEIKQLKRQLVGGSTGGNKFFQATGSDFKIVKSTTSSRMILLAFLAGGFLSLVVLVVWRSLQSYWKRQPKKNAN